MQEIAVIILWTIFQSLQNANVYKKITIELWLEILPRDHNLLNSQEYGDESKGKPVNKIAP